MSYKQFVAFLFNHALNSIPEFLVYDDGCHLRKFATNPVRRSLTDTTQKIAAMEIVIDRMHFRGHADEWCRQHCDPYHFVELEEVCNFIMITHTFCMHYFLTLYTLQHAQVDTEICEQTFSWLSRYARITRHMNKPHFLFFLLYVCELHNRKKLLSL